MSRYYKPAPKLSEMNANQLGWEIDRLKSEISKQPINDSGAIRYRQREAVIKLGEVRTFLTSLLKHLPEEISHNP